MTGDTRGAALPPTVDAFLRELVNALGKATMYPPGHRFVAESTASLIERVATVMADRNSLTVGILPNGLLLDGLAAEPLPAVLRDFAARMHRKNIAIIQFHRGVGADEVGALLTALAASDADETVGRDGLRLDHVRVEPTTYEALALAGTTPQHELDDTFWATLAETALDRRIDAGHVAPTVSQLADAISERAAVGAEGAKRVYEALSAFASALTGPSDRSPAAYQVSSASRAGSIASAPSRCSTAAGGPSSSWAASRSATDRATRTCPARSSASSRPAAAEA